MIRNTIPHRWWLARWADAKEDDAHIFGTRFPSQREGLSSAWRWSRVFIALGCAAMVFCFSRTQWGFYGGVTAAKQLYAGLARRVLEAPMAWFDEMPTGRLVSRFSYDTEQIDIVLTQKAAIAFISVGWAVTGLIILVTLSRGTLALFLVPVYVVFYRLQIFYRRSSVDLQRLDAVSRSPLSHLVNEVVDASPSIRAYGVEAHFDAKFLAAVDANTRALLCWTTAQRWIGLRLDACAATVATATGLVVALFRRQLGLSPAFTGMLLVWAFHQTTTFMYLITSYTEAEAAITSVERVTETVPSEFGGGDDDNTTTSAGGSAAPAKNKTPVVKVSSAWPTRGDVVFDEVCLRYRPGLPLALDRLSFRVPPGKRCGVCGRSGAGKSSLIAALLRLTPLEAGDVRVDGAPLSQLDLRTVRQRAAAVIAQDPVLFSGRLRDCVDPFGHSSDDEVRDALRLVSGHTDGGDASSRFAGGHNLDMRVEDAGTSRCRVVAQSCLVR